MFWHALRNAGSCYRLGIALNDSHVSIAWIKITKPVEKVKKGLGGELELLALTQSYALSHVARIVAEAKSSCSIAIFLPSSVLSHLELILPEDIPPADLHPTLSFLLEQQGFTPLDRFSWDAEEAGMTDSGQRFQVMLTPTDKLDTFYTALGLSPSQVAFVGATPPVNPTGLTHAVVGPWLCDESRELAVQAALWDCPSAISGGNSRC